jgi:nucleoside-diphosphate-sugar epimerase
MRQMEATCVAGSARLFDAARAAGVQRLIFISTISAFDRARAAYGRSKFLVEKLALERGGLVIRLGLVYGEKFGGVFGNIRDVVRRFRVVPLIGSGMAPQYCCTGRRCPSSSSARFKATLTGRLRQSH